VFGAFWSNYGANKNADALIGDGIMNDEELKQAIILYVKDYHEKHTTSPSLRKILNHFRKDKLNFTRFYNVFPGRLAEACSLAGVPVPEDRIKRMQKVTETSRNEAKDTTKSSLFRLTLTEEQTKRLLGISHLEGGIDPLLIVDRLLDNDGKMRKSYRLNFSKAKRVSDFLDAAIARGWHTESNPNIVSFLTDLWNAGCMSLSSQEIANLMGFLIGMKNRGWKANEIPEYLTKLSARNVHNLSAETVKGLVEIVHESTKHKWEIGQFVDEATSWHNSIYWFRQYKKGLVSAEEAKKRVLSYS
jgi:sulfur relay (sulfurtransferase) DsrC/TusE family protein